MGCSFVYAQQQRDVTIRKLATRLKLDRSKNTIKRASTQRKENQKKRGGKEYKPMLPPRLPKPKLARPQSLGFTTPISPRESHITDQFKQNAIQPRDSRYASTVRPPAGSVINPPPNLSSRSATLPTT